MAGKLKGLINKLTSPILVGAAVLGTTANPDTVEAQHITPFNVPLRRQYTQTHPYFGQSRFLPIYPNQNRRSIRGNHYKQPTQSARRRHHNQIYAVTQTFTAKGHNENDINDGKIDIDTYNFPGLGCRRFYDGEELILGMKTLGMAGQYAEIFLTKNKTNEKVIPLETIIPTNNFIFSAKWGVSAILKAYGPGLYNGHLHVGNKHWGDRPIELYYRKGSKQEHTNPNRQITNQHQISTDERGLGMFVAEDNDDGDNIPEFSDFTNINRSTYLSDRPISFGFVNDKGFRGTARLQILGNGREYFGTKPIQISGQVTPLIKLDEGILHPGNYRFSVTYDGRLPNSNHRNSRTFAPERFTVK